MTHDYKYADLPEEDRNALIPALKTVSAPSDPNGLKRSEASGVSSTKDSGLPGGRIASTPSGQNELRVKVAELLASVQSELTADYWPSVQPRKVDELRLQVALVSGWRDIQWRDSDCANNADWYGSPPSRPHQSGYRLLDWTHDLNACHVNAQIAGANGRAKEYGDNLVVILREESLTGDRDPLPYDIAIAQATDHCRAFVATMEGQFVQGGSEKV